MKNPLNKYIETRLKKVEKNLRTYIQDIDPERLHQLRVEIKKTKAIISFINATYRENYSAIKLKPLFQKAGEIRELQINIQLLSTLHQNHKKQIIQLERNEAVLCEEFINMVPRFSEVVKTFRKSVALPAKFPGKKRIRKYFIKKVGKARRNLQPEERESMHLFRTRIKVIMYVFGALPKKMQKLIVINKPYIDRLQEKAGDWHDTYAAISWLSGQALPGIDEVISTLKEKEREEFNDLILFMRKLQNEISI